MSMNDPFVPGDLLINPRYEGTLYLVCESAMRSVNGVPVELLLVRISNGKPCVCYVDKDVQENWGTNEGLKEAGFEKTSHFDNESLNEVTRRRFDSHVWKKE